MKQHFLYVIFIVSSNIALAQTTINENTPGGGIIISDSTIIFNQEINNKKEGWWKHSFIFNPSRIKKVSYYKDGLKNGEEYIFYFNGEVKVEGYYKKGKKDGTFIYYEKNMRVGLFRNSIRNGLRTGVYGKYKKYSDGKHLGEKEILTPENCRY